MLAGDLTKADPLRLMRDRTLAGVQLRRFACIPGCGRCCRYRVSLLQGDIERLQRAGVPASGFLDLARPPAAGFVASLAQEGGRCVFLDGDMRCRVYHHRPLYCRLYPYIRESYLETQLDVDLSCPGVGEGERLSDEELERILLSDGLPEAQEALVASRRLGALYAERLLGARARLEPFEDIVCEVDALAAKGLGPLLEAMRRRSEKGIRAILPFGAARVAPRLDESAGGLIRDYLLLWSRRQTLMRWADAFLCVTPTARSRAGTVFAFLAGIADEVIARTAARGPADVATFVGVLRAIRDLDSYARTYCQGYRLEGPVS